MEVGSWKTGDGLLNNEYLVLYSEKRGICLKMPGAGSRRGRRGHAEGAEENSSKICGIYGRKTPNPKPQTPDTFNFPLKSCQDVFCYFARLCQKITYIP